MNKTPDFDAAAGFLAASARVLDRRVFQRLFGGGAAGPVRDAVAAYRNADGGFGHALEPDCRTPASQPAAVEMACGSWTWPTRGTSAWCATRSTGWPPSRPPEGGAAFVQPSVSEGPHAPWWVPAEGASLIQTGQVAALLYARGMAHPWLDGAARVMWSGIEKLSRSRTGTRCSACSPSSSTCRTASAPRPRSRGSARCCSPPGSSPSTPGPRARRSGRWTSRRCPARSRAACSTRATIDAHLDHLAGAQRDDGGWMFNWPSWSPAAEADWRGFLTVDALRVLRANGRG